MRVPDYLDDDAKTYWKKHAKALEDAGILTDRDIESFALLCRIWSLLKNTDPDADPKQAIRFVGLSKQYQSLARQFSMLPRDRRKDGIDTHKTEEDEFGL